MTQLYTIIGGKAKVRRERFFMLCALRRAVCGGCNGQFGINGYIMSQTQSHDTALMTQLHPALSPAVGFGALPSATRVLARSAERSAVLGAVHTRPVVRLITRVTGPRS